MRMTIWLTTLCLSVTSYAATLSFPEEFYPLQVDDKVVEHSLFSKIRDLSLEPGQYRLKLKYSDLYELGYDEHEVVESAPFWVDLVIPKDGDYRIVFDRAQKVEGARRFAKNPSIRVQSNGLDRQLHAHQVDEIEPKPASLSAAPKASSLVALPSHTKQEDDKPTPAPSAPISAPPSAAMMLDFWWQQASQEERSAFLKRVNSQK